MGAESSEERFAALVAFAARHCPPPGSSILTRRSGGPWPYLPQTMTELSSDLDDEAPVPPWFTPTLMPPRLSNGRADKLDRLLKKIGVDHPDRTAITEARQLVVDEQFRLGCIEIYLEWVDSVIADSLRSH